MVKMAGDHIWDGDKKEWVPKQGGVTYMSTKKLKSEQERLTNYATSMRYPGDWEPITRAEAENAVAAAKKVHDTARALLPK